jgi:hypothetical protein
MSEATRLPAAKRTALVLAILFAALTLPAFPSLALERDMTPLPAADTPRDLDTPHLFTPPATRPQWQARARRLREQILFSSGLLPMPPKTPLNPRITGKIEGPDYTIENVAIETLPGFYLCGNLYRPKGRRGPFPAIVNPHGHWSHGRLEMQPDVASAAPAPAPPAEGRANLVAIGVNLARQGFVVFAYDMVGYNDTQQVDHRFAGTLRHWAWGVSLSGLQLWNSIRAVDYLCSLPEVDRRRIGATGASGGGTQTFLLCAVDDRIQAAVPVNMISAHMQGGCLCENGPGLRLGTDNVEIAAMFAPKPLLLISCTGDWTKDNPKVEGPAIRKVYALYGAQERMAVVQFNYGHNYNRESREAMYAWFGRWLKSAPDPKPFREQPFEADVQAMRVWTAQSPMPENALREPALTRALIEQSQHLLTSLLPKNRDDGRRFAQSLRPALAHSLGIALPAPQSRSRTDARRVLIVSSRSESEDRPLLESLHAAGYTEARRLPLEPVNEETGRLWNAFFSTYNRAPTGDRVQKILDTLTEMQKSGGGAVDLIGAGEAGLYALLARGLASGIGRAAIDAAGFDTENEEEFLKRFYAPGIRRVGDLRTAALLGAPAPLLLYATGGVFRTEEIEKGCLALNAPLRVETGQLSESQIVAWLQAK